MRSRRLPGTTVSLRAKRHLGECAVKSGTILICRSGAYGGIMGRAAYVTKAMDGWAISEHVNRCKITSDEFISEYVFAFLASMWLGYPMIAALRLGKDVPEVDPDELGTILVPKPPWAKQEKIAVNVRSALDALDCANALEDKAQKELLAALNWNEEEIPEGLDVRDEANSE